MLLEASHYPTYYKYLLIIVNLLYKDHDLTVRDAVFGEQVFISDMRNTFIRSAKLKLISFFNRYETWIDAGVAMFLDPRKKKMKALEIVWNNTDRNCPTFTAVLAMWETHDIYVRHIHNAVKDLLL